MVYKLLSVNRDAKTIKGVKQGYLTGVLYLAPSEVLCPCCSEGCRKACLYTAGHGRMRTVQMARMRRNGMLYNNRGVFEQYLLEDIGTLIKEAKRKGLKPCVRLNGTSDIDVQVEFRQLLEAFPDTIFYDYTKCWNRVAKFPNYYLCYSRKEWTTEKAIDMKLKEGYNVAVVFDKVPETWLGHKVITGDDSDLRFLDPAGVIVALKAKGAAVKDTSGFVVRVSEDPQQASDEERRS